MYICSVYCPHFSFRNACSQPGFDSFFNRVNRLLFSILIWPFRFVVGIILTMFLCLKSLEKFTVLVLAFLRVTAAFRTAGQISHRDGLLFGDLLHQQKNVNKPEAGLTGFQPVDGKYKTVDRK